MSEDARLSGWLRERIISLQRTLDRTAAALRSKPTPGRIHDVRVAARRLRALLRTFRRELHPHLVRKYRAKLKALTHDLEAAREADVARRAVAQLAGEGRADVRREAGGLRDQVAEEYRSARQRLRSRVVAVSWECRLSSLRRLSMCASLVPVSDEPAATAILRQVDHARRRLRFALRRAGKTTARLHRLRLKVKRTRYLMEDGSVGRVPVAPAELRGLRRLQDCLGDLHDDCSGGPT
jgi:CHAD domain-containing protein